MSKGYQFTVSIQEWTDGEMEENVIELCPSWRQVRWCLRQAKKLELKINYIHRHRRV